MNDVGSDVVATGTGSLDLDGVTFDISATDSARVKADIGLLVIGPSSLTAADIYLFAGDSFGVGGFELADSCLKTIPATRCPAAQVG